MSPAFSSVHRVFPRSWINGLTALLLVAACAGLPPACLPGAHAEIKDKPLNGEKPLSLKELCLLLRGGYTPNEVLAEVNTRRLLDPINDAAEKQLQLSGATPAFINTLKAGNYNLSAADAAAARQKQLEIDQREQAGRAAEARVATASNQGTANTASLSAVPTSSDMANQLRGKLAVLRDDGFVPYNDAQLPTKKYYGIYFSASWCGPCRKFTPLLVDFYNKVHTAMPDFEVVLVCEDKSAGDMQRYVAGDKMPWPVVPFATIPQMTGLTRYANSGIPDLVIVDAGGKVLFDSFRNGQYVGPARVLQDFVAMLKAGS